MSHSVENSNVFQALLVFLKEWKIHLQILMTCPHSNPHLYLFQVMIHFRVMRNTAVSCRMILLLPEIMKTRIII